MSSQSGSYDTARMWTGKNKFSKSTYERSITILPEYERVFCTLLNDTEDPWLWLRVFLTLTANLSSYIDKSPLQRYECANRVLWKCLCVFMRVAVDQLPHSQGALLTRIDEVALIGSIGGNTPYKCRLILTSRIAMYPALTIPSFLHEKFARHDTSCVLSFFLLLCFERCWS